jgi:hypothetical protein
MVEIKVDTSQMDRALRQFGEENRKRIEVAAQRAILKTARAVMKAERVEMGRAFDRPTRWTLNAFRVALGKERLQSGNLSTVAGSSLTAEVKVKDGYWYRADDYLSTQIFGGERKLKAFERALQARRVMPAGWYAVPGEKATLDAYGNQRPSEIRQILSWFGGAERVLGSTQNMTDATRARRRKGTKTKRGFEYFAVVPGRTTRSGARQRLRPGIYRRLFSGFGASAAIEPVLIFVRSTAYKPRLNFYGVGQQVVNAEFPRLFRESFEASK